MMKIQTLVSTMKRNDIDFVKRMNVETDVVIGNQNGKSDRKSYKDGNHTIIMIDSQDKGLSRNRNLTIKNSNADICVLADDDVEYISGYSDIIISEFSKYPDADIIIFNLIEEPVKRYVIKNPHQVRGLEFLRYGSVRIAFKRKSVVGKVCFDERFGAGGDIPIGEDTIFLGDCIKRRLKIMAVPQYILKLSPSESTWFEGYTDQYFYNKGKMYYRIFRWLHLIISLQDILRHRKIYKCNKRLLIQYINMINGARNFKKEI